MAEMKQIVNIKGRIFKLIAGQHAWTGPESPPLQATEKKENLIFG